MRSKWERVLGNGGLLLVTAIRLHSCYGSRQALGHAQTGEGKPRSFLKGKADMCLLVLPGQSDTPVVVETSPSMPPLPPSII